ncbi:MAG TPA: diacylglycerol kinase family protein, partial [Pyrinomonadaceae bacterium]|nr:diacylglycerol kinase family protein [Pyrinomonadaceae bacterium]
MPALPLVIVNPASAGGATGRAWPRMASDLARHFGPFERALTSGRGEASEIARRESEGGRAFIIACGGDGTIHEVADGILSSGRDAELGILPSGTGGDFRRTLGIPVRTADAARRLRKGSTRRMDAGRVVYKNDAGEEETRYFLNVASFGMGGEVIRRVKEGAASALIAGGGAGALGGKLTFALAALRATLAFEKPTARLSLDGGPEFRMTVA